MRHTYTAEQIIRKLKEDERNYIAEFWAGKMPGKEGSHTGGITLNTRNPYIKWEGLMSWDDEFISAPELKSVMEYCDASPWGGKVLGGTEYRLKPELRAQQ